MKVRPGDVTCLKKLPLVSGNKVQDTGFDYLLHRARSAISDLAAIGQGTIKLD